MAKATNTFKDYRNLDEEDLKILEENGKALYAVFYDDPEANYDTLDGIYELGDALTRARAIDDGNVAVAKAIDWYEGNYDCIEFRLDEEQEELESKLIYKSKFFNMNPICQKANVSYNSYRSWKSKGTPLSKDKIEKLLKVMKEVAE